MPLVEAFAGCHNDSVASQYLIGSINLTEQFFFFFLIQQHELFLFCVTIFFSFYFSNH